MKARDLVVMIFDLWSQVHEFDTTWRRVVSLSKTLLFISRSASPLRGQKWVVPIFQGGATLSQVSCWISLNISLWIRVSVESSATCLLISRAGCFVDRIDWNPRYRNRRSVNSVTSHINKMKFEISNKIVMCVCIIGCSNNLELCW